jgi:hypothetical protein
MGTSQEEIMESVTYMQLSGMLIVGIIIGIVLGVWNYKREMNQEVASYKAMVKAYRARVVSLRKGIDPQVNHPSPMRRVDDRRPIIQTATYSGPDRRKGRAPVSSSVLTLDTNDVR